MPHIYLDNAATSFPKPEAVYEAVERYQRGLGTAVGRGAYARSLEVQRTVDRCRRRAAELFGAPRPEQMIFTFNGTDGLNLALHGLLQPGDHVVTSSLEHNSVLRPLRAMQSRDHGIEVTSIEPGEDGFIDPAKFRKALRQETALVALIHASNVSGAIQPIAEVGEIAREAGALFLVDAAQSAGHLPLNVGDLPVDLLACPGHKGLLGPLGTGLLYVRPGVEDRLHSTRQGGTGSQSEDDRQPDRLPDKYESGNHNAPGLCGLEQGLAYLQETGLEKLRQHETELTGRLLDGLAGIGGVTIHGPRDPARQVGVVSVTVDGFEPQVLAMLLDEQFQIETRAGLHCAPRAHQNLGTFDTGGTVRLSLGPFTTPADVDTATEAFHTLTGA